MSGIKGITLGRFREQIDELCRHLEPIDWPQFFAWFQGTGTVPDHCFLLTFDDGLLDHVETVVPTLQDRGLKGLFFVPGEAVAERRLLPAHAIHILLSHFSDDDFLAELRKFIAAHGPAIDLEKLVPQGQARSMYAYETPERARLKYSLTIALPIELRNAALSSLFENHVGSMKEWAEKWYMNFDHLAGMQYEGHTIGAHGYSHEPYARLDSSSRRQDMRCVAEVLRENLGAELRPICYPYGSFNDDTRSAAAECRFVQAFTTQRNWVRRTCDSFCLSRVDTIHVSATLKEQLQCALA